MATRAIRLSAESMLEMSIYRIGSSEADVCGFHVLGSFVTSAMLTDRMPLSQKLLKFVEVLSDLSLK